MTVLFMGAEMAAFTPSDSAVVESTAGSNFDSSFARTAIVLPNSTNYAEAMPSNSATTAWLHLNFECGTTASASSSTRVSWYDSSANERVRITYIGSSNTLGVSYWNGSAFVSAGTATVDLNNTQQVIDLNVVCNSASGSIVLYVAGTERINSGTISTTSITNLKKFRVLGAAPGGSASATYFSQAIMADEPTIGWRLLTRYPNAAGSTSSWTGAYSDIDEATYNDADFIYSGTVNQVSTFGQTGAAITGYVPRAVCVSARAKKGATGPANIQLALRSAGTDYFSSSQALGTGYGPFQNIWEDNPATSADFLAASIDALQPGVKSIT